METITLLIEVNGDRSAALDTRDDVVDTLKSAGYYLIATIDGMTAIMREGA